MFNQLCLRTLIFSFLLSISAVSAVYAETEVYSLILEKHVFTPSELTIPANKKVRIAIENKDSTAEEFDSFDLNRERVIFPYKTATIFVGPLPPGRYDFFGEFHPQSAQGVIVVEEAME